MTPGVDGNTTEEGLQSHPSPHDAPPASAVLSKPFERQMHSSGVQESTVKADRNGPDGDDRQGSRASMELAQETSRSPTPFVQEDGTLLYSDWTSMLNRKAAHTSPRDLQPTTSSVGISTACEKPRLHHASEESSSRCERRSFRRPKRSPRIAMGDAETEHLLLASKRLLRIHKVLEDTSYEASSTSKVDIPPLDNSPQRKFNPKQQGPYAESTFHDEPLTSRQYLLGRQNTNPVTQVYLPRISRKRSSVSPQLSDEDEKTPHKRKRIGRPRGSPNKTKIFSINETAASKRRLRALEFSAKHRGKGRGRGRPPGSRARSESEKPQGFAPMGGLLFAAQLEAEQGEKDVIVEAAGHAQKGGVEDDDVYYYEAEEEYGDDRDYDDDLEWYQSIDDDEGDGVAYFRRQLSKPSNIMNRVPLTITHVDTPATSSSRTDRSRQKIVLATPTTIERQQSALDVLADQAASASKDAPSLKRAYNPSGKVLAAEFEIAESGRNRGPNIPVQSAESRYFPVRPSNHVQCNLQLHNPNAVLGDPFNYHPNTSGTGTDYPMTPAYSKTSTQACSSLNQQIRSKCSTPDILPSGPSHSNGSDAYSAPRPGPGRRTQLTIAQQLSVGMDALHPLIDQSDIDAGMTPAAALAKKSRSPYVKWTPEEDELLVKGVAEFGTHWDAVSKCLPDRSYHQCRQRWLRGLKCELPQTTVGSSRNSWISLVGV